MGDTCTVFCANLSPKVSEELLYELFLQAGPLNVVKIPRDMNGEQRSYAFIEFKQECSVDYAIQLFQDTYLYGKELQLNRRKNRNQDSSADGKNHMKRQASLPIMQQISTGMIPGAPHPGYMNMNALHHPMIINQRLMFPSAHQMSPPFYGLSMPTEDSRSAAFLGQTRAHRHHSETRSINNYQLEDARDRDPGRVEEESRRDRAERHHRRSHSDHQRRRSRSRSRDRSCRNSDRSSRIDNDEHNRHLKISRSRY